MEAGEVGHALAEGSEPKALRAKEVVKAGQLRNLLAGKPKQGVLVVPGERGQRPEVRSTERWEGGDAGCAWWARGGRE